MDVRHRMTLSGWQGATSGLRVDAECRNRVLMPLRAQLRDVEVELPGQTTRPRCRITPTFWTTCPELRSAEIGRWMTRRGDKPWTRGNPPRYNAELVGFENGTARLRVVG